MKVQRQSNDEQSNSNRGKRINVSVSVSFIVLAKAACMLHSLPVWSDSGCEGLFARSFGDTFPLSFFLSLEFQNSNRGPDRGLKERSYNHSVVSLFKLWTAVCSFQIRKIDG